MKFSRSNTACGAFLRGTSASALAVLLSAACTSAVFAQQAAPQATLLASTTTANSPFDLPRDEAARANKAPATDSSSLPEAPAPVIPAADHDGLLVASLPATTYTAPKNAVAPRYAKYIASDETAQKINAHDKVIIGLRDLYSVEDLLAIVSAAGYEHLTNGEPNYGTNSTAFGKRVGAAAIRESSQGIFTDVILHPLLHDDPRYYAQGENSGFVHRTVYAVTRVFITRTDSGHATLNAPLLLGYAGASAMTPLYYPQINRNFKDTASNYGGSLGGAAIGFLFSEFSDSLLESLHFKKKP